LFQNKKGGHLNSNLNGEEEKRDGAGVALLERKKREKEGEKRKHQYPLES